MNAGLLVSPVVYLKQQLSLPPTLDMKATTLKASSSVPGYLVPWVRRPLKQHRLTPVLGASRQSSLPAMLCEGMRIVGTGLCASAVALALLVGSAYADGTIVRLPASPDPQVFAAQRTMVEAWTIVGESFVDDTFNGKSWADELREHMMAAYNSRDPDAAFKEISSMLAELGDPYTRRIPAEEYQQFKVSSDGELQGVGLLIANEPVNGHLLVLAPIKGGPAERAGVLPGDEVISINGNPTDGLTGESAARVLRGLNGTEVRVKLVRRSEQIPGVPGRPDPKPLVQYKEVRLKREKVNLNPVYSTAIQHDGQKTGYIRLSSFSSNAPEEVEKALTELESDGCDSYILDLRNNPGGLVRSGVEIARLWLNGDPVMFNISARGEDAVPQRMDDGKKWQALTSDPLVVLVNNGSASASEILSGALRDYDRAVIVGDENTYGKGRIQSVFELQDGSALFVTVAKYQTPKGTEIDLKGIHPDSTCAPDTPALRATGLLLAVASEADIQEQLAQDGCVLRAEELLSDRQELVAAASKVLNRLHI